MGSWHVIRTKIGRLAWHGVLVLLGNAILALAISAFVVPANLIVGGASGLSLIIKHFVPISLSTCVLIINIVAFIAGLFLLGKRFAAGTVVSSFAFPFFLAIFDKIQPLQHLTNDILLSTIYAGILTGIGVGIVLRLGYSTGGMDIPPILANKYTGISVGMMMNVFDVLILVGQIPFSNVEGILYGILNVVISTWIIDKMMVLGESNVQVIIISKMHEQIANMIFDDFDRGCTYLNITTGYMEHDTRAVLVVLSRRQFASINEHIQSIDPNAFVIASEVHSVKGRGFTLPNIDIEL